MQFSSGDSWRSWKRCQLPDRYAVYTHFKSGDAVLDSRASLVAVLISFLLVLLVSSPSRASDDPSSLFQTKCAACHGFDGRAETPMGRKEGIPSFASTKVQKSDSSDLEDFILNGGKQKKPSHAFARKGVSEEEARKLSAYIKDLGRQKR